MEPVLLDREFVSEDLIPVAIADLARLLRFYRQETTAKSPIWKSAIPGTANAPAPPKKRPQTTRTTVAAARGDRSSGDLVAFQVCRG
jgi:hypothetical protein